MIDVVGDDQTYLLRMTLQNDTSSGNEAIFFVPVKFQSLVVNPALGDANQATITVSLEDDFAGPVFAS